MRRRVCRKHFPILGYTASVTRQDSTFPAPATTMPAWASTAWSGSSPEPPAPNTWWPERTGFCGLTLESQERYTLAVKEIPWSSADLPASTSTTGTVGGGKADGLRRLQTSRHGVPVKSPSRTRGVPPRWSRACRGPETPLCYRHVNRVRRRLPSQESPPMAEPLPSRPVLYPEGLRHLLRFGYWDGLSRDAWRHLHGVGRTPVRSPGAIVKSGVRRVGHAAALLSLVTSMPSLNFTPSMTLPSWRKPRNRRQDCSALMPIL